MRSRLVTAFACVMTALCPVICTAALAGHADEHAQDLGVAASGHSHDNDHHPHHQHDPNGDPVPHGEHSCICTGSTTPGTECKVPSLAPAALITGDVVFVDGLNHSKFADRRNPHGLSNPRFSARLAPLLI